MTAHSDSIQVAPSIKALIARASRRKAPAKREPWK